MRIRKCLLRGNALAWEREGEDIFLFPRKENRPAGGDISRSRTIWPTYKDSTKPHRWERAPMQAGLSPWLSGWQEPPSIRILAGMAGRYLSQQYCLSLWEISALAKGWSLEGACWRGGQSREATGILPNCSRAFQKLVGLRAMLWKKAKLLLGCLPQILPSYP